jgi:hypothetical protein
MASLTRKHFIAMAKEVKRLVDHGETNLAKQMADQFVKLCRESNPRFDTSRFLQACGL